MRRDSRKVTPHANVGFVKWRRIMWGILIASVLGLGAWVAGGLWIKRGVTEPAFERVAVEGDVEIRAYGPTVVAVTEVYGEQEVALNEGFRRLAGYIFGANRAKTKIAMTAPVSARPSEKIAMTAPVSAIRSERGYSVSFTMPAERTLESLPVPDDARVHLEVVPKKTVAAVRFSGRARPASVKFHTDLLVAWAKAAKRSTRGAPVLAQYDPPFVVPLMRRNEILLELE